MSNPLNRRRFLAWLGISSTTAGLTTMMIPANAISRATMDESVRKAWADVEQIKQRLEGITHHANSVRPIIERHLELYPESTALLECRVRNGCVLAITVKNVMHYREQAKSMLRELATHGYHMKKGNKWWKPVRQSPAYHQVDMNLETRGDHTQDVNITWMLPEPEIGEDGSTDSGATCQYVQVGVEQTPIMKMVCGDELAEYLKKQKEQEA